MLQLDYQKRPSVQALTDDLTIVLSTLSGSFPIDILLETDLLGTDGPLKPPIPRWDDIFPPATFNQHIALFERYKKISATRNLLLGPEHPTSIRSACRLAWASLHRSWLLIDDGENVDELFIELVGKHEKIFGEYHVETLAIKQEGAYCSICRVRVFGRCVKY